MIRVSRQYARSHFDRSRPNLRGFLLILLIAACSDDGVFRDFAEKKAAVDRRIDSIHVGMDEATVQRIAGRPMREEHAPFDLGSLPMTPGCKPSEGALDCRLLPAIRRVRYVWRIAENKNTTDIEVLDVYYASSGRVTCAHHTSEMEMTMTAI